MSEDTNARAWMRQWNRASGALAEQKAKELAAMTDEEALAATETLLALASPPAEERGSGLVEQQRLFARLRHENP